MSADLSIHVFEGITKDDLAQFFSSSMGSKYFSWAKQDHKKLMDVYDKISQTPEVWIGEVSWLKAALFEDPHTFIPNAVARVNEIINEDLPVIDDELITKIKEAFTETNNTIKEQGVWDGEGYRVAEWEEVQQFLEEHRGKRVFTVSW